MAREAPGRKEHHVDADIILRPREARGEHSGGRRDTAQAIRIDRKIEIGGAIAPLDLNEGDRASAPRDKIDFANGNAEPLAQYAPAVQAQPPGRATFGLASVRFGGGTVQARSLSASARA